MKKIEEYSSDDDLFFKLNELIDWQNEMVDYIVDLEYMLPYKKFKLEANTPQEEVFAKPFSKKDLERITGVKVKADEMLEPQTCDTSLDKVTRIEVIDEDGRVYSRWEARIYLHYQDGGKTLKIFVEQDNDKRD